MIGRIRRDVCAASSSLVLFVADLLHPVDDLAVELLLNGDVRHSGGRCGAVPVLLARREPDHVARPDLLDRAAPALSQAAARRHDERLTERVGVPGGARARLERDAAPAHACRVGSLEQGINTYTASEVLGRSFARGL